jgi:hypothetical protein
MKRVTCWIGLLALLTALAPVVTGSRAAATELGPGPTYSLSSYLPDDNIPPPPPPPGVRRDSARVSPPLPPPLVSKPQDKQAAPAKAAPAAAAAGCASCQEAGESLQQGCCFCPRWTITAGAIIWTRTAPASSTWLSSAGGTTLFDPQSFNLGWDAGPRIDLVRHFEGWDFEVLYFGIDSWSDSQSFAAAGMHNTLDPGANPLSTANFLYTSKLYNLEANAKLAVTPCIDVLAGFRWIQIDDDVTFQGTSAGGAGSLSQNVFNNLYGFQLGAEGRLFDHGGPFWLDAFVKAGVYDAHVAGNFSESGSFGATATSATLDRTAFVGEVGINAHYQLTRHLAAYAGYDLMWVDGVTLAPDALSTASLSNNSPLYHGAVAGLELHW